MKFYRKSQAFLKESEDNEIQKVLKRILIEDNKKAEMELEEKD